MSSQYPTQSSSYQNLVPDVSSSQESVAMASPDEYSSPSDDEITEAQMNDPIVKQYAKADPVKPATEEGPGKEWHFKLRVSFIIFMGICFIFKGTGIILRINRVQKQYSPSKTS